MHVVPSREESWSQSAVLARGLGVPVVGTPVDGPARTLDQSRGVLVPPDDPRALAGALPRVLGGERPDPVPDQAYTRQFPPSAAAAVYAGPAASCSPAVPHPGSQPGRALETSAFWP